jgi:hypothetical protein
MNRTTRLIVLVTALMSVFAATSSTAGAVTWHNSGDTSFTATGGPTSISGNGKTLSCTSSDVTGTTGTSPFTGAVWTAAASGSAQFTGCSLAGATVAVTCTYTGNAATWAVGPPTVTNGNVGVFCTSTIGGALLCITEGSTAGSYTNPAGTTNGHGTLPASSSVTVTNGPGGSCALGNNSTVSITPMTLTLTAASGGSTTPHRGPIFTRTP